MPIATLSTSKPRSELVYPHAHWYFLAALVLTWVGFARTYFAVIRTEPLLHHIHGALMGGWILLLIVQPILYQRRQMKLHRTLGRWGAFVLIPAIVLVGLLMVRRMFHGHEIPPSLLDQLGFLDLNGLIDISLFVGMAVKNSRDVQRHARWISCTVITMIPPALVRAMPTLPVFRHSFRDDLNIAMGLACMLFLLLQLNDWRIAKRVYPPYPVALACTVFAAVGANYAYRWDWWNALTAVAFRS